MAHHHHASDAGVGAVAKLDAALLAEMEKSVHEQRLQELKKGEDVRFWAALLARNCARPILS